MKTETLFPQTARMNDQNHLEIGGCDLVTLAHEYGTPLYIFDEAHVWDRAREVRDAFRSRWTNSLPLYATKAYFSPYLARLFKDSGLGIDVTSEGELEIARRVDFARDRIYLHGNNKTPAELKAALAMGVAHIVVDNHDEIELLARIAAGLGVTPRVLLRLAPAIDPHTHRYLATGVAESKFGLPLATGDAWKAAQRVIGLAQLQLVGLHVHIGSQIFEWEPYRDALHAVLDFARKLREAFGFELRELDLGGGWGVAYTEEQENLPIEGIAQGITDVVARAAADSSLSDLKLLVEPGRAIIAQAAVAVYAVGGIKRIPGVRTFVSVDGGMGDNIRPALYGARYTARVANKMQTGGEKDLVLERVTLAGRYCEQGDLLIEDIPLPPVVPGDLIVVPVAGAYQLAMASNYNAIPRPAVLAVRDGAASLIRRRETPDDLLRCEL